MDLFYTIKSSPVSNISGGAHEASTLPILKKIGNPAMLPVARTDLRPITDKNPYQWRRESKCN